MKNFLISLFLFIGFNATAQLNIDSLNQIWLNTSIADSIRFEAMHKIIGKGYVRSNPDTAIQLAQQLYISAIKTKYKNWQIRSLDLQGASYYEKGEFPEAMKFFERCLLISEEIESKKEITHALSMIGKVYKQLGETNKALKYLTKSIKISEEMGKRANTVMALTAIGNIYAQQKKYDKALEYFEQILSISEEFNLKHGIAASLHNIGKMRGHKGDEIKALDYYNRSLIMHERLGSTRAVCINLMAIGRIYENQGEINKALGYYNRSLQVAEKMGNKRGISAALIGIGNIYKEQGQLIKATSFGERSLVIAEEIGSPPGIKRASGFLYSIYKKQDLGMKALKMHELYIKMRDSIQSIEAKKGLIRMEVEHDYEKRELISDREHQKEIFKKNETRNILVGGVILALLFSIGIFSRLRYIRKTNSKLEIAKNKAEQSEQYKQQFLANMSHEIRTPMHAISGMVKILKRKKHPLEQDTFLNAMHSSSDNLIVILNDVLDISKIEAGKLDIESIAMQPTAIIKNVIQILKFKAEEKGLILSSIIDEEVPPIVMGDPTRLNQILINLLGNSIKFTEKGSVTLLLTKVEDKLKFSISDTGIGIPEDRIDKIFGAFEQANSSTSRNYGGTGLGLSITQQLTELQNGKIWVDSEEGKGSTFFVELPLALANSDATGKDLITEDHLKSMSESLKGARILLVEDNAFNQMIAQDDLNYYIEDVKIDTVENGLLAVEKFQANDYDLILMDVQMPVMNGFEATQKIRDLEKATGKENTMPIIAMTASLLKSEVDSCYTAGMNNYIPKPYQPQELIGPIYTELKKGKI